MRVKATEAYFRRTEMRIISLACRHTLYFTKPFPVVGEELWCIKCNDESWVIGTKTEYRVSCLSCTAGARFGRAVENAHLWAVSHRTRRPGHIVIVRDGNHIEHTYDNRGQLLIAVGEDPPF